MFDCGTNEGFDVRPFDPGYARPSAPKRRSSLTNTVDVRAVLRAFVVARLNGEDARADALESTLLAADPVQWVEAAIALFAAENDEDYPRYAADLLAQAGARGLPAFDVACGWDIDAAHYFASAAAEIRDVDAQRRSLVLAQFASSRSDVVARTVFGEALGLPEPMRSHLLARLAEGGSNYGRTRARELLTGVRD